jgi:LysR family transcriptional regulator, glycine cleavage system transcriptional activator
MTKTTPRPSTGALEAFESAARHGSFTRAATELHVTQGAVSRQIRQLEQQLGTRLFQRVRQRVVLTDAGLRYRDDVRRMLDQLEVATQRAMAFADGTNVLTLAVVPSFSSNWLAPRLPRFTERHPNITINCFVWLPRFDFGTQQCDAAIHLGPARWPDAQSYRLMDWDSIPMCSAAYRAALRLRTSSDLTRATLLHQINRPTGWSDWFAAEGIHSSDVARGPRFELVAMLIEAAVAGLGVALLPMCLTETERGAGRLTVMRPRKPHRDDGLFLVVPDTKRDLPALETFRDWLMEEARADRAPGARDRRTS